jgi:hypothetical protein
VAIGTVSTSRFVRSSVLAGIVAGLVMGAYAMMASAWMGQGFFTPLYGIASPLIGPSAMETSMMQGVYLQPGPALLGLMVHMAWAVGYAVTFGLAWRRIGGTGALPAVAGVVYGLAVMVFMAQVVLRLVGAAGMPAMIGFSFVIEHALFGLLLGLWPTVEPGLFPRAGIVSASNA